MFLREWGEFLQNISLIRQKKERRELSRSLSACHGLNALENQLMLRRRKMKGWRE
jgi:hypothetical protein